MDVACCPICAAPEPEVLAAPATENSRSTSIVRCRVCAFIYRRQNGPDAAPRRAMRTSNLSEAWSEQWLEQRIALIEDAVPRGHLLDIGCGSGRFLTIAQRRGWQVAGVQSTLVDESAYPVMTAHGEAIPYLREGVWAAGSFEAITLWGALEHCLQPKEVIRLAAHYCRLDGILVIETLNGERLRTAQVEPMSGAEHLFSAGSLTRVLARYGFRVERLERSQVPVFTPRPMPSRPLFTHRLRSRLRTLLHDPAPPLQSAQSTEALLLVARFVP